jgi:hypothetical protein
MKKVNMFCAPKKIMLLALPMLALITGATRMMASPPTVATSTSLVSSGQSVAAGTAITLSANVIASGNPITAGLVVFCDATATYCEGPAVLGSAQLSASGIATLKLMFGPGTHSVKAVFAGTHACLTSTSPTTSISVSGSSPTTTTTTSTGSVGSYTLTATVGYHGPLAPSSGETVSFADTSNANYALGTATITGVGAAIYNFITIPSSPVATGNFPTSVVTADFNNDGIPDLAVANFVDNTVSVFSGDGSGGFTAISGSPFAVSAGPAALAVADVNADGMPDIVAANSVAGDVSILLANSSGSFTAYTNVTAGIGPQSITVGDFDGNGIPDLAVANVFDSTITVLIGDGTGNFTSSIYPVGQNPSWVGMGDFNGDGKQDLAVVNTTDNSITVLQGDNFGSFTPMTGSPFPTVAYPVAASVGDFNSDGKADLAVISGTNNSAAILLNTGAGFAASSTTYPTGISPSAIITFDFNGDGKQDLVISNENENTATILTGDGTGAFSVAPESPISNLNAPAALAIADFNGDGIGDLAITNIGSNSTSIRPLQITQSATATLASVVVPGAASSRLVAASYPGDSLYTASTSTTVSLIGSPITTTNVLSVSPSTSVEFGRIMQLTALISPPSASNYTTTGTVKFFDGGTLVGQSDVSNGQALLSLGPLTVNNHSLTAIYPGDSNFAASNSIAVAVAVKRAATSVVLAATNAGGSSYTFTAVVSSSTGAPSGLVSFFDGTNLIGSSPLAGGIATYSTSSLTAGSHSITATYTGDGNYAVSTSNVVSPATGDFALSAAQQSKTVLPGQSVGYQITVNPNGNFANPINFSVSGLPSGATATFSPSSVTPGVASAFTTMTIVIPNQLASMKRLSQTSDLVLALLLLPVTTSRRLGRFSSKLFRVLGIGLLLLGSLASVAGLTGCANGNGYFGQAPRDYTLTVTARSGTLTHTTSVMLNVQ